MPSLVPSSIYKKDSSLLILHHFPSVLVRTLNQSPTKSHYKSQFYLIPSLLACLVGNNQVMVGAGGGGGGSPCGACKFLRRKCASECVFAPYFSSEAGPARFAAIHKVFGASNVSKLLSHLPVHDRCEAVLTIAYEAQARIRDPVYGCVSHIFALQQQVAYLQAQLMQAKAQLAINNSNATNHLENHQWRLLASNLNTNNCNNNNFVGNPHLGNYSQGSYTTNHPISPQSSLESIDHVGDANFGVKVENNYTQDYQFFMQRYQPCGKRVHGDDDDDMGELQELAFRMMRS